MSLIIGHTANQLTNQLMHLCEQVAMNAGRRINTALAERRLGGVWIKMDFVGGLCWVGLLPDEVLELHLDHLAAYIKDKWPEVFDENFKAPKAGA